MFQLGDTVPLAVTVKDAAQAPVDSTDIALTILKPDGTTDTVAHGSLTHSGTGLYSYPYIPLSGGHYVARWTSTTPQASYEETFDVQAAFHAVGIVSRADAKAALNMTNATSDDEIDGFILAATAWIEEQVGPVIPTVRTDRIRSLTRTASILLPGYPVEQISGVVNNADGTTIATTDYWLTPAGQLVLEMTAVVGSFWPADVTVTYTVGASSVAALARLATLELIEHWWQNSQQAGSLGGQIVGSSSEYDTAETTVGGWAVPERVSVMIDPIRRGPRVR